MWSRLSFLLIALFWVVMNGLLWRSEFGERSRRAISVPVEAVWQKVLTAPDDSSLDIMHHGKKVGFCRWSANAGEAIATGKRAEGDLPIEGMVKHLAGYTLNVEGNVALEKFSNRLRFDLKLQLATNGVWREFDLRLSARPHTWQIHSRAADRLLVLHGDDESGNFERTFRFDDLADPAGLLNSLSALAPVTRGAAIEPWSQTNAVPLWAGLPWEAFHDWLNFGRNKLRVYRLQARVLDQYQITVFVSPVGEILRVELPDELVLLNDALVNL